MSLYNTFPTVFPAVDFCRKGYTLRYLIALIWFSFPVFAAQKPLTVEDIMKFNHIKDVVISEDGEWIAYALTKDRGDGEAVVRATKGGGHFRIPLARRPQISKKSGWAMVEKVSSLVDVEKAGKDKKKKEKLKKGATLINLIGGQQESWERVKSWAFSDDELWFARHHFKDAEKDDKKKGRVL